MRYRGLRVALGWAIVATIVWFSLVPSPPKLGITLGDKLGHFAAYGTLMFWFCQLYARRATRAAYAAGFAAMGIALEFLQDATGYRSLELLDMVANTVGVALGWGLAALAGAKLMQRFGTKQR